MENSCTFCAVVAGRWPVIKIWENEKLVAFLDSKPVHPGHTLLIPKQHADSIFEVSDPLYVDLFEAAKTLAGPIQKFAGTPRIGFAIEGFGVPHAHLHIIPITHGAELVPNRSAAPEADSMELNRVAEAIKKLK
jgi:histidine triad (HIT) family protein